MKLERNTKFFDNLSRHFVIGAQLFPGEKIEITAAYNFLRARELYAANSGNSAKGLSLGFGAIFSKLHIRYAMAFYQSQSAYHQLGLNFRWKEKEF